MQKWVLYACAILTITSIFHMLTPDGAIKGTMRFILNLFLIGLILMPFFKNLPSSKIQPYFNSQKPQLNNEQQIKNQQKEIEHKNLENALTILLHNNNFQNFKLDLILDKQTNKTTIQITFEKKQNIDKNKLINLIKKETGIEPKIVIKEI